MRPFLLAVSALPFAACASTTQAPLVPLTGLRTVDVQYKAELAPGPARILQPPAEVGAPAVLPSANEPASGPEIAVRCTFVRMEDHVEDQLLGFRRPEGRVVTREALDALDARVETVTSPSLRVLDGQRGHLAIVSQTSFVRAFQLTAVGDTMIADPEIGVASEGFVLETRPRLVDGGSKVELELDLVACHLVRPMREISARMPGASSAVTLQMPLAFDQRLETKLVLAPGEAVVLRGLVDPEGRPIVAFVESERAIVQTAALDR